MDKKYLNYLYVILPILFWGSTPAFGKILLKTMDGLNIYFYGALIASISLFIFIILSKKLKELKLITLNDFWPFIYLSLILFLYYLFLYKALSSLPAQEAFIINYLWPIMVVIFSIIILNEKFTWTNIAGIILSFLGVVLIATKGNFSNFDFSSLKGVIYALLDAACYGLFSVLGKRHKYNRFVGTMFYYLFGAIFALIFILVTSHLYIPSTEWKNLLWIGVLPYGLAVSCWFLAVNHFGTAKVANYIYLTPFVSLIYIYFMIGEKILLTSVIGLIIIITGILIQNLSKSKPVI